MPFDDGEPIVATSLQGGTAAAPTAGTSFVSLAAPLAGIYEVHGFFVISGAAEPQALNVRLSANNVAQIDMPSSAGVTAVVPFAISRIQLDGVNVVKLTAIANATASTVYSGAIFASRIG